jgi:hypothetical protein
MVLVGKTEGKRPLGRPRCGWVENIKLDLQEVGCGARTRSIWFRIRRGGGHCECGNEISGSIKYGEFLY